MTTSLKTLLAAGAILAASSVSFAQHKKEMALSPFSKIDIGWAYQVELKKSTRNFITVDASDKEVLERVEINVNGSTLDLDFDNDFWKLGSNDKAKAVIEYIAIDEVEISGAANVSANETIKSNSFTVEVSGAGKGDFTISCEKLSVDISGAGKLNLTGDAVNQSVHLSGAGNYYGDKLISQNVEVHTSGAGSAKVHAAQSIEAHASGAGSISYSGNPTRSDVESSGAGSIRKN
ncbi:head GIN domain-containing protein [Cytophagales bacterium LB-30]|uniref:Head GIN domain-containing protein n=1 Tax=Shiella aurantiaca TaxID=3058365 RepID=A0ABT8F727_9BACT|nr:head GIN domain-containing protein [Shiella aurantiaca]MDN4166291.1 head GIN domain-containing protein [Shiella aurantiaca]